MGALTRIAAATLGADCRHLRACGRGRRGGAPGARALRHPLPRSRRPRRSRSRRASTPRLPSSAIASSPAWSSRLTRAAYGRRRCGSLTISRRSRSLVRRATSRSTQGSLELVTVVLPVSCLTAPCVARSGAARVGLPLVHASVLARDGRIARASAGVADALGTRSGHRVGSRGAPAAVRGRYDAARRDLPDRSRDARHAARRARRALRARCDCVSPAGRRTCASQRRRPPAHRARAGASPHAGGRAPSRPGSAPRARVARHARSAEISARAQCAGSPGRSPSPSPHELEELVTDIEQGSAG